MNGLAWVLALLAPVLLALGMLLWLYGRRVDERTLADRAVARQLRQRQAEAVAPGRPAASPPRWQGGPDYWHGLLLCAGMAPTPGFYLRLVGVPLLLVALAAWLLHPLGAAVLAVLMAVLGFFFLWRRAERRRRKMVGQLPDFLEATVRLITIGNSMPAAFQAVSGRIEAPLAEVMQRVDSLSRSGRELDAALRMVSRQYRLEELYLVSAVVGIATRYGGRSDQVLERMAAFMRDLAQARQELVALSAEIRLSAWVLALMPLAVGGFVLMFNRDMFMGMWEDPVGWKLLVGAGVLQIVGSYWLYRLARSI